MSNATVAIKELDLVVLGQVQFDFVLNGVDGYSLSSVLTPCCAARAVAIEHEISMVSEVVRKRTKKLDDLGNAMGLIAYIVASLEAADAAEDKYYPGDAAKGQQNVSVRDIGKLIGPYELTYTDENGNKKDINPLVVEQSKIKKNDIEIVQSTVKLAIDKENNAIKQDCNTLQGYVDKRDDAYELIGKLENKINNTAKTVLGAMGS